MTREFTEHMSYRENAPAGARSPFGRGVEKAVPSTECTGRGRADIINRRLHPFPSKAHGHSRRTEDCLCCGELGCGSGIVRELLWSISETKVIISIDLKDRSPECGMYRPIDLPQFYSCSDQVSAAQKGDASPSGIPEAWAPPPQARQAVLLLESG